MYLQFFGLTEAPFSITPDPAFVYLSPAHRDALAHLLYGVGKGGASGFVQLTGEVGTGKTTICRCLLEQVPADTIIALILNPMLTPRELLAAICEELGIDVAGFNDSSKELVTALNAFLLQQHALGRRVVVVIDEAQNLSPEALEQVRLLTNIETAKDKLLQMVLLGQPELRLLLQRQDLRQLAQRITARYHLTPLAEKETFAYIRHRMQVAGARQNPFKRSAMRALHRRSGGVPRLINIIADRALAGAYTHELGSVNSRMVHAAANEVQPSESRVRRNSLSLTIAMCSALLLAAISVFMLGLPAINRQAPAVTGSIETSSPSLPAEKAATLGMPLLARDLPSSQTQGNPASAESTEAVSTSGYGVQEVSDDRSTAVNPDEFSADTQGQNAAQGALGLAWLETQHGLAWWGLAELWRDSDSAKAIEAACEGQAGTGYACLKDQGSWARVQRLGLPLILVLQQQGARHVVLRGLDRGTVLLGAGQEPVAFSREMIEPIWLGDFIVAWPQAANWPVEIKRGDSGAAVDIVMRMAAQAETAWTGAGVFDAGFESWLVAFQRQNGLTPDGIVGPKTLLYLMAPTITEPRLATDVDGGS